MKATLWVIPPQKGTSFRNDNRPKGQYEAGQYLTTEPAIKNGTANTNLQGGYAERVAALTKPIVEQLTFNGAPAFKQRHNPSIEKYQHQQR